MPMSRRLLQQPGCPPYENDEEPFSSYGQKVLSRFTDGTLMAVGYGCLGAAPVILVVEYASEYLMLGFVLAIAFWIDNECYGRRNK